MIHSTAPRSNILFFLPLPPPAPMLPPTEDEELSRFQLGVSAMGAGLIASFVVTPVERVKASGRMRWQISTIASAGHSSSAAASLTVSQRASGVLIAEILPRLIFSEARFAFLSPLSF